jgi:hypothetical protein
MTKDSVSVVPIGDLKAVVNLILDHIVHDLNIESVPIEEAQDFYWDLEREHMYDVQNKPPVDGIGRLSDDWDFLTKMGKDRHKAAALMLIHIAPLLRYIGEKVGR